MAITSFFKGTHLPLSLRPDSWRTIFVVFLLLFSTGCSSAYYAAWEKLGYEKRDLLKSSVEDSRQSQVKAVDQFQDALEALQGAYNTDGGDLQRTYNKVKGEYDSSTARANDLKSRISKMESLATALFKEWQQEANSMENMSLRSQSLAQLSDTRRRYDQMSSTLNSSAQNMDPVLTKFRDYVLFLKHNLNAKVVGSLRGEATDIESGIRSLVMEMEQSVREIDKFVDSL